MLTLWYISLGWKEYNKPFRKAEQPPPKPADSSKKPDLIPQKKDVIPTQPKDIKKPDSSNSIPTSQPSEPSFFNNKIPEPPKMTPKIPEMPKSPELSKAAPKIPGAVKMPEAPKIPPRTPETSKMPDFRLAPEVPKKPESPKTPEPTKSASAISKSSENFKPEPSKSDSPKVPEDSPSVTPSRRPESVLPDFPPSVRNPAYAGPTSNQSEFPIPPYLPGTPQSKPLSKDDELFAVGSDFSNPSSNRSIGNLRDLSYAKGEFPGDEVSTKVQENLSRVPKYMEQSLISNPDSLESDEEDEDF